MELTLRLVVKTSYSSISISSLSPLQISNRLVTLGSQQPQKIVMNALFRTFVRGIASEKCMNRVTLIGRVGADAQLKGTLEHPVVIFSVATNSGGARTEWHKISVFKPGLRQVAEDYVKSGSRLFIEGKLSYGHVVDKQGNAIPTTSIIAEDIIFLSKTATGDSE